MILVDSDVLIAHLRGWPAARSWLLEARTRDRLGVSAVSLCEISGGMRSGERREVARLLTSLQSFSADLRVGYRAGEFMRSVRRSRSPRDEARRPPG